MYVTKFRSSALLSSISLALDVTGGPPLSRAFAVLDAMVYDFACIATSGQRSPSRWQKWKRIRARENGTVKESSLGTCAIVFLLSIVVLETPEDSARSLTFANSPSNVDLIFLEGYLEPRW